jgi:hypothetical protein
LVALDGKRDFLHIRTSEQGKKKQAEKRYFEENKFGFHICLFGTRLKVGCRPHLISLNPEPFRLLNERALAIYRHRWRWERGARYRHRRSRRCVLQDQHNETRHREKVSLQLQPDRKLRGRILIAIRFRGL